MWECLCSSRFLFISRSSHRITKYLPPHFLTCARVCVSHFPCLSVERPAAHSGLMCVISKVLLYLLIFITCCRIKKTSCLHWRRIKRTHVSVAFLCQEVCSGYVMPRMFIYILNGTINDDEKWRRFLVYDGPKFLDENFSFLCAKQWNFSNFYQFSFTWYRLLLWSVVSLIAVDGLPMHI